MAHSAIGKLHDANIHFKIQQRNMHKRDRDYCLLKEGRMVFFFDNIGAVKPETYGAQPVLELLRQFFDYGEWYNTAAATFTGIFDATIFAAVSPPGRGLFDISNRLRCHPSFNGCRCCRT
jgi:hypothetical protein